MTAASGLLATLAALAFQAEPPRAGSAFEARVDSRRPPSDTLVLTRAVVLPMVRDTALPDRTLVVVDGRIAAIHPTGNYEPPAGARVRDLGGAYVLPGLIDAHVHLREPHASLVLFPANGVTTVVNLEGAPEHLALRDSLRGSTLLAPEIVSSGPFIEELVDTPAEARTEVRRQHAAGYELIKIHGEIFAAAFAAVLDEAKSLGMPVVAHRPDNLSTDLVLESGLAALAHAEELLGSALLEEPADLSADSVAAIGRRLTESGVSLITTLGFFARMRDQATDRFYELISRPELAYVSPERRHAWLHDGHREYIEADEVPWYDTAVRALRRIVGALHEAGGVVVAGTDTPLEFTIPGVSLLDELGELVAAGLTPHEALRAATIAPAGLLGRRDLGRVEVGARADLLIVEGDPRESLERLRAPRAVVLRGRWVPAEALEEALSGLAASYARDEVRRAAAERVVEEIADLVRAEGIGAAAAEVERLDARPELPDISEGDLNALGYRFLDAGEVEAAIDVFRLNVALNPGSANVHDSLGEAYVAAGRDELAEESYRRALEMDAELDSARRALERLAGKSRE